MKYLSKILLISFMFPLIACAQEQTQQVDMQLRVQLEELLIELCLHPENPNFQAALQYAVTTSRTSWDELILIFFQKLGELEPEVRLGSMFANEKLGIGTDPYNKAVREAIRLKGRMEIQKCADILVDRITLMTAFRPEVEIRGDHILIKAFEKYGSLEEWETLLRPGRFAIAETYPLTESYPILLAINEKLRKDSSVFKVFTPPNADNPASILEGTTVEPNEEDLMRMEYVRQNPLFSVLTPIDYEGMIQLGNSSAFVGMLHADSIRDKLLLDSLFQDADIQALIPDEMEFLWTESAKHYLWPGQGPKFWELICIKKERNGSYAMEEITFTDIYRSIDPRAEPVVSMNMAEKETQKWAQLTEANVGQFLAMIVDHEVYSYPVVNEVITTGQTQLRGNFSELEAKQFAVMLKGNPLPVPLEIIRN